MSDKDPEERKKENELDPNAQLEKPTLAHFERRSAASLKQDATLPSRIEGR
ncbi:hypothetical protein [Yoonia sp. MH D7]